MTFLNPTLALVGLACVAVPIIIHILMRRRRKPVAWGAMRFLLEAYKKQRRRLNLEQLLLLAARCVLIALLALAVGKPILGAAGLLGSKGPRTVFILVDNSLASSARSNETTTAFEYHKSVAESILRSLDASLGDRAALIALGSPADPLVLPPTSDIDSALSALRALKATDGTSDLPGALSLLRDLRASAPTTSPAEEMLVLLSDFRTGSADLDVPLRPLTGATDTPPRLLASEPTSKLLDNIALLRAEPVSSVLVVPPGEGERGEDRASTQVRVELRRSGLAIQSGDTTKLRARVAPPGDLANVAGKEHVVRWKPGEETTSVSMLVDLPAAASLRAGAVLRVSIDRDAIEGDNTLDRPLDVRDRLIVSLISPPLAAGRATIDKFAPGDWLSLALEPSDDGTLRSRKAGDMTIRVIDPARDLGDARGGALGVLAGSDVVVLARPDLVDDVGWRRVAAAADAGAVVLVTAPPVTSVQTWGDMMSESLGLEWSVARESRALPEPTPIASERPTTTFDMLAGIAGELPDLTRPVRVFRILEPTGKPGSFEPLLALSDGTPLIIASSRGAALKPSDRSTSSSTTTRGFVLYMAASPDLAWSDLPAKPLMVPLLQELVRQGLGRSIGTRLALAGQPALLPTGAVELVSLNAENTATLTADPNGRVLAPLRSRGLWQLRGSGGTRAGLLAVNADTRASRTEPRAKDEIGKWLSPVANVEWLPPSGEISANPAQPDAFTSALDRPKDLPPISLPLLIAAGVIALAELVMARFFSHAKIDDFEDAAPSTPAAALDTREARSAA